MPGSLDDQLGFAPDYDFPGPLHASGPATTTPRSATRRLIAGRTMSMRRSSRWKKPLAQSRVTINPQPLSLMIPAKGRLRALVLRI